MASQTIYISSPDELIVKSSDSSPLNVVANPLHPDTISITVSGGGPEPPQPSTGMWIGVFQLSTGQIAQRHDLSGGFADAYISTPDPHGTPVVIGDSVWSFRDGVWSGPAGEQQQFGQAGDTPLGGQFGAQFGKCVARNEARYGSDGRIFKFPPGSGYVPEYWIGAAPSEISFAHCCGSSVTPWFVAQAYPGGLWFLTGPHQPEFRVPFDYQPGDYFVSAHFQEGKAGLARVRGGFWSIWYQISATMNSNHPDLSFQYGGADDLPLACG